MYIKEHPRLINEIPRGSKRYNSIKKLRSDSERANSTVKEDIQFIKKTGFLTRSKTNILEQLAAITLLLKKAFTFIVKITNLFRKILQTNDHQRKEKLKPPNIPKSILNIIQRK